MSRPTASSSSSSRATTGVRKARHSPEAFESLHKRNQAAEVLQSYEMLSWYSFARCESLAQTRIHFQNLVAGFTAEDEEASKDWKEDFAPHPVPSGTKSTASRKGKERLSSGSAIAGASGGGDAGSGANSPSGKGKGREKGGGSGGLAKKKRRSGGGSS